MSKFVILRIAADGIYECVGKSVQGHATLAEATDEAHRLLRSEPVEKGTHLAIFEREAVYAAEVKVKRQ